MILDKSPEYKEPSYAKAYELFFIFLRFWTNICFFCFIRSTIEIDPKSSFYQHTQHKVDLNYNARPHTQYSGK